MKLLLHICCGPCAIGPFEQLVGQGHQVTGLFYNPNIHPLIEFRRRLKALKVLQERIPLDVIYDEQYGLVEYLSSVRWQAARGARCADCYRLRLDRTAREARERGFDAFSTTLLASEHQAHEHVRRIAEQAAKRAGVEFHYADWRPLAQQNHARAAQMRLYLQSYCGCVFSEWERFRDTSRHLYRGSGPAAG